MSVWNYSSQDVTILLAGYEISGYAAESFIKVEQAGTTTKTNMAASNYISRTLRKTDYYEAEITLSTTSPSNTILNLLYQIDRSTAEGIIPVFIRDGSTGTTLIAMNCWVEKTPNVDYAASLGTRIWKLCMADVDVSIAGAETGMFMQLVGLAAGALPDILKGG